jgi:hypothetical protein
MPFRSRLSVNHGRTGLAGLSKVAPWGVRPDARFREGLFLKVCGVSLHLSSPHPVGSPLRPRAEIPCRVAPLSPRSEIPDDSYLAATIGGHSRRSPGSSAGSTLSARCRTRVRAPCEHPISRTSRRGVLNVASRTVWQALNPAPLYPVDPIEQPQAPSTVAGAFRFFLLFHVVENIANHMLCKQNTCSKHSEGTT